MEVNKFFQIKWQGFKRRRKCAEYGIYYFKSSSFALPSSFLVNGRSKELKFINRADPSFVYEFTQICLEDCYQLSLLGKELSTAKTIVDVGANQGLFVLAARQSFPTAIIHCYEPNSQLGEYLTHNATALNAVPFFEAVTRVDTKVDLNLGETDLHSTTVSSESGTITGTAFKTLVSRAGGKIDLLKMDCEGAEWDLLDDIETWAGIRSLTMEYHLWARPGMTVKQLEDKLGKLGFRIVTHKALANTYGLISAIKKS